MCVGIGETFKPTNTYLLTSHICICNIKIQSVIPRKKGTCIFVSNKRQYPWIRLWDLSQWATVPLMQVVEGMYKEARSTYMNIGQWIFFQYSMLMTWKLPYDIKYSHLNFPTINVSLCWKHPREKNLNKNCTFIKNFYHSHVDVNNLSTTNTIKKKEF